MLPVIVPLMRPTGCGKSTLCPRKRLRRIALTDGVKLAYDLTLPAAAGRFPVALEYD
jgi:predicted acyl esterase